MVRGPLALLGLTVCVGLLTAAPPAMVPENLAEGKPATASSFQDEDRNIAKGSDGNPGTRWCANGGGLPQWYRVDLGKPEEITGVRIEWEFDEGRYAFLVEGSTDAKSWVTLVDQRNNEPKKNDRVLTFPKASARYVRLTITGSAPGAWASFFEFEVLGTKMVPAKAPTKTKASQVLSGVKVADGFEVTLFAAPPDISYPTCLASSSDGTVYVGVDLNGSLGAKPGKGKVVRCIDTDNDGKADKFNTFCEVESPRGLWWDGDRTLIVLHPPFITAYRDTDNDGKADVTEDLVTGLGFDLKFRGADHTTNGFRYGIDGFLYVAVGDYGAIKAQGKDGRTLQLYGGGVVRVRPDGTGLALVADGTRNIYDVAVSPTMDLFTRDNTNDGGGWDVRLSHIVPTAHYGYPRLFKNFASEIIQPLADYGGGSPCGSLFIEEPGLLYGLYTCEWGRSAVYRHPLLPKGATYTAGQEPFLQIPRPTDIDVDAADRIYVSSWKDGGFDFSRPDVGYIARVTPTGWTAQSTPYFPNASQADLIRYLTSFSHVRRTYAQRELLKRGANPELIATLTRLAREDRPLAAQSAIVFTLAQLLGPKAPATLTPLLDQPSLREPVIRALSDTTPGLDATSREKILALAKDADPRIRAQVAITLGRAGQADPSTATTLLTLAQDSDPIVSHVAVNALAVVAPVDAVLKAIDESDSFLGAGLKALQLRHDPSVVTWLIAKLGKATTDDQKRLILVTLARLHSQEAPWEGKWWGTRPDTTGPYYYPTPWAESARIATTLKEAISKATPEQLKWLLPELTRHRIESPELMKQLAELARKDPALRQTVLDSFTTRTSIPAELLPVITEVARAADSTPAQRVTALRGLMKANGADARKVVIDVLTASPLPADLEVLWGEFARDGQRVSEVAQFQKLVSDGSPATRELALAVLASVADRNLGNPKARQSAEATIAAAWSNPEQAEPLLKAIRRLALTSYAPQLRKLAAGPNATLAASATETMKALKLDPAALNRPTVSKLTYDQVVGTAKKTKGDAEFGGKLFARIGCANCHTVTPNEPLKGPLLAGITARYNRDELLESILKPSAKIAQGFETYQFDLLSGKTITGFIVRESGTEVEVRDNTGATLVIKKDDLDSRKTGKVSVMPEKLVDELTPEELASILAYLESLKAK